MPTPQVQIDSVEKCQKCGRILHDGTARILMGFSVNELLELAFATSNPEVRNRIAVAVRLLDPDAADGILNYVENPGTDPK